MAGSRGRYPPEYKEQIVELVTGSSRRRGSSTPLLTPYANIALAGEDTRGYRLGWQVKVGPSLSITLENAFGDRAGMSA